MGIIGSGVKNDYQFDSEEETTTGDAVRRRNVEAETISAETNSILRSQQFTPTSGFRLVTIRSTKDAPGYVYGKHEEEYEKYGPWTTTTTTTT